jgi:hypothetical protein
LSVTACIEYGYAYPSLEETQKNKDICDLYTGLWLRLLLAISTLHFSFAVAMRLRVDYTNKAGDL